MDIYNPDYYQSSEFQAIDVIEEATKGLTGIQAVCTGNVIKYLIRWNKKNGVEDLKKAQWYLGRLISDIELESEIEEDLKSEYEIEEDPKSEKSTYFDVGKVRFTLSKRVEEPSIKEEILEKEKLLFKPNFDIYNTGGGRSNVEYVTFHSELLKGILEHMGCTINDLKNKKSKWYINVEDNSGNTVNHWFITGRIPKKIIERIVDLMNYFDNEQFSVEDFIVEEE